MKLIQKYGKKKVYIGSAILIVASIAIGVSTRYIMEQNYKQKVLNSIGITFVEDASIEYGTEKVDYNALIKEKTGEPEIQLPIEEMNTKELGKKQVTYVLSKDGYSKNQDLEIEIKDTKAPEIVLKEDVVILEYERDYDFKENIESVKDPIDGDIPYAESAGENNYYIVEGTVDRATSGDYTITIKAMDKNKIASEKTYTVHVNEKKVETPTPQLPFNDGNSNTPPANNSGESLAPPSNNSGKSSGNTPPPTTCSANGQWKSVGNSGYANYDYNVALQWGKDNCPENHRISVITVHDICGNSGWSVSYSPLKH